MGNINFVGKRVGSIPVVIKKVTKSPASCISSELQSNVKSLIPLKKSRYKQLNTVKYN